MLGSLRMAVARLVSGPTASTLSRPGRSWANLINMSAAASSTGSTLDAGNRTPPIPLLPCTSDEPPSNVAASQSVQPMATGMSVRCASSSRSRVLRVAWAALQLPLTVPMPSTSTSALASR